MVVVYDLLNMFVHDPQIEVNEARYLVNEVVNSITKSRAAEDALVVVSMPSGDNTSNRKDKPSILSNKMILPRFNKCIEIINNDSANKMIDIKIRNSSSSSRRRRRNKNTDNDFHNSKLLSIKERELLIIEHR
jgi:hypothetical protein